MLFSIVGKNAAEYCRARVPEMLKEAFPSDVNDKTLKKALKDVFAKTDKEVPSVSIASKRLIVNASS